MFNKFDRRNKNIKIFEDTMACISRNSELSDAVEKSIAKQKLYLEDIDIDGGEINESPCRTVISKKRSFEAAGDYARQGKKVCVLNFASATNPGGGVTSGSSAQEEALCRCSTLYPCLDVKKLWDGFYQLHRNADNPLHNDDCIYTPGVVVIKSDTANPELMPEKDWYQVDVITCAAPNLRDIPSNRMNPNAGLSAANISRDQLYELHLKRIESIFKIAIANGAEVLILGAFGCGAFRNPPEVVAKAFKTVQNRYEKYFDVIEYAVYCRDYETANYDVFCGIFKC